MVMGSSLGELKLNFIFFFMVALSGMGRVRGNGVIIFVKNSMENWVSGIFPETAWRVARERQATHAPDLVSGYQR